MAETLDAVPVDDFAELVEDLRREGDALAGAVEMAAAAGEHDARALRRPGALPRPPCAGRAGAVSRPATDEAGLLAEGRRFVGEVLAGLRGYVVRARALRRRLRQTKSFREVDGKDVAGQVATWDLVATLEVNVMQAAEEMASLLRDALRHAPRVRRRDRPAGGPR